MFIELEKMDLKVLKRNINKIKKTNRKTNKPRQTRKIIPRKHTTHILKYLLKLKLGVGRGNFVCVFFFSTICFYFLY